MKFDLNMMKMGLAASAAALAISGCGSSSSSSGDKTISMVIGTTYQVTEGQKVVNKSGDAQLTVLRDADQDYTEVTLNSGAADIVK